jgi:hypothetical protein
MAVVTTKSAAITNRDATPKVLNNAGVAGDTLKQATGLVTAVNGDSIGSKYIFFSVPSNAYVRSLKVTCPDIGTTTAADIGLYRTVAEGGAVVDVDYWASAVSLSGGALSKSEVINEAGAAGGLITNFEKRIWETLGLTSDPGLVYDVVATLTAAADAGGAIVLEMQYQV